MDNELMHYGVLGMKWGVRRYQNKDGTMTKTGQKRYNKELAKVKSEQKVLSNKKKTAAKIEKLETMKKEVSAQSKNKTGEKKQEVRKRTVRDLSDEELAAKIKRLEMEKQYKTLVCDLDPQKTSRGKAIATKILENSATNIGTQTVTYVMGTAVNKALAGVFDDKSIVNPKKGQKDK